MKKYNDLLIRQNDAANSTDGSDNVQPATKVWITLAGTRTIVDLYDGSDAATANKIDNPITTDDYGRMSFYVADGDYDFYINLNTDIEFKVKSNEPIYDTTEAAAKSAKYLTVSEAQTENLKVGQYVILTDRANALCEVVSVTPTVGNLGASGANFLALKSTPVYAEHFGIEYSVDYQDAKLLDMFAYAESKNCRSYYSGKIHLNTNINISSYPNLQFFGIGDESELWWPNLTTGVGFSTGGVQHTAISIEKMKMAAPILSGLQVCKFAELYQGCRIADLIVQGGDIGCEITDSWVSCFDNIYIRDGGTYGLIIRSPNSNEQVNALNLGGFYVQGYNTNWYFDGVSGGGRAIFIPSGASEKSRKTSMIIDGFGSVNFGAGFYFEQNYTDAQGPSGEVLDKTKPIDILIKRSGGVFDAVITLDKTYFARANNFNTPTSKVGIYIDSSVPAYLINDIATSHVCNTTSYIDHEIYNDSSQAVVVQTDGKSNSGNRYYGECTEEKFIAYDNDAQTGFTSTWGINNTILSGKDITFIDLVCTIGGTTTSSLAIVVVNKKDGSTLATLNIPANTYVAGDALKLRVPNSISSAATELQINSPASGDNVSFECKVATYSVGKGGRQFRSNASFITNTL